MLVWKVDVSRFIYLVVLKYTGRTCNAHPVIGGVVVGCIFSLYVLLYCFFKMFLTFLKYMKITPSSVFLDLFLLRGCFFCFLDGDRKGGGDNFGTILEPFWDNLYNF